MEFVGKDTESPRVAAQSSSVSLRVVEESDSACAGLTGAPSANSDVWQTPGTTRVLVIDEDERARDVLAGVLSRHRYEVLCAANAEEALEHLRQYRCDLVLSNVQLSGMNGLDLTGHLTEAHPDLSVVLLTAPCDADLMRHCLRRGASDVVIKPFDVGNLPLVIERNLERHALYRQRSLDHDDAVMMTTVQALAAAIDAKEPFTAQHSRRVVQLANVLADAMQLPAPERRDLALAAQVHDVGKIGIPDTILQKAEELTAEEWETVRQHPVQGAEIIGQAHQLTYVSDIVRHHHEWMNGGGYPDGLHGEAIPLLSRVIAVVDAYEVMTTDRVYRRRISDDEARRRLYEDAGTQFDSAIVETFIQIAPEVVQPAAKTAPIEGMSLDAAGEFIRCNKSPKSACAD